jgi:hypothetical protein
VIVIAAHAGVWRADAVHACVYTAEKRKKTRADLYRAVDADYYGFRDEEDGKLEELERAAEEAAVEAAIKEWEQATGKRRKLDGEEDEEEKELSGANVFRVPSTEAIERALIERRKQVLHSPYPPIGAHQCSCTAVLHRVRAPTRAPPNASSSSSAGARTCCASTPAESEHRRRSRRMHAAAHARIPPQTCDTRAYHRDATRSPTRASVAAFPTTTTPHSIPLRYVPFHSIPNKSTTPRGTQHAAAAAAAAVVVVVEEACTTTTTTSSSVQVDS